MLFYVLYCTDLLRETLATMVAAEGPFTCMDPHVSSDVLLAPECLPAHGAGERPLPGVNPEVVLQMGLLTKRLTTCRTWTRSFFGLRWTHGVAAY